MALIQGFGNPFMNIFFIFFNRVRRVSFFLKGYYKIVKNISIPLSSRGPMLEELFNEDCERIDVF
jgi:hypothetical protein